MFSYYGSKSKVVQHYPAPQFDKIIEPFAGAANYSLKHCVRKRVLINDLNADIYKLWKYLQTLTIEEIEAIPQMKQGDDIRTMDISDDMRLLLGFVTVRGVASPHNIYSSQSVIGDSVRQTKNRLKKYYNRVKDWEVANLDYRELKNEEATWFIDPPYQFGGEHYPKSSKQINFEELAEWCKSRNGQVIVCENTKADWLPFKPMIKLSGMVHKTTEAIWSNVKTTYDNVQQQLFEV